MAGCLYFVCHIMVTSLTLATLMPSLLQSKWHKIKQITKYKVDRKPDPVSPFSWLGTDAQQMLLYLYSLYSPHLTEHFTVVNKFEDKVYISVLVFYQWCLYSNQRSQAFSYRDKIRRVLKLTANIMFLFLKRMLLYIGDMLLMKRKVSNNIILLKLVIII